MLHSQTTLILAALLFLALPLLMWWATAGQRNTALNCWCIGSLMVGTGIVLIGIRSWVPPWLSFNGGNTFLLMGMVLWPQSLRVMLGKTLRVQRLLLILMFCALYYSVLLTELSPATRGMAMRGTLGLLAIYTAWMALKIKHHLHSHNAVAIALCYLVLGAGLWAHVFILVGGNADPNPFSNTWDASIIASVALATSAVGHFCFTGMVLDASIHEQVKGVHAHTLAAASDRLETQLRLMDRQDRVALAAGAMAHDLNQPLTSALTHAQMAQKRLPTLDSDPTAIAQLMERVAASLRRASAILDRIRVLAKVQGVMRLDLLDLREVVRTTISLSVPEWHKQGVQVDVTLGKEPLWCRGDEVSLSQVVLNLISNAIRAMQAGTQCRLEIKTEGTEQEVQVVIRDHGPGLPAEVLAQLGAPFRPLATQDVGLAVGLGLGLAISREIAQQHQGRLILRNHPQGGAEAILVVPRATAGQV